MVTRKAQEKKDASSKASGRREPLEPPPTAKRARTPDNGLQPSRSHAARPAPQLTTRSRTARQQRTAEQVYFLCATLSVWLHIRRCLTSLSLHRTLNREAMSSRGQTAIQQGLVRAMLQVTLVPPADPPPNKHQDHQSHPLVMMKRYLTWTKRDPCLSVVRRSQAPV